MAQSIIPPEYQEYRVVNTSSLTLKSRVGHRHTVKDIFVYATAPGFLRFSIGNVTLACFRDNLTQAKMIMHHGVHKQGKGFLSYLVDLFPDIPFFTAAQDEDIVITRDAAAPIISVIYEDSEAEFVAKDIDGASKGKRHLMIIELANNAAIGFSGEFSFDRLVMPRGLSPFEEDVDIVSATRRIRSGQKFTALALAADLPMFGTSRTRFLHLYIDQVMLFTSETNQGLTVDPDVGVKLSIDILDDKIFKLPSPLELVEGHAYSFRGYAYYDGTNALPAGSQKLFLIGIREILT